MILSALQNRHKILGLNERNLEYVRKYNPRAARNIADTKTLTKKVLRKAGIPVTKTLAIVRTTEQLDNFTFENLRSFVVKPVNGSSGSGIEVVFNKNKRGEYVVGQNEHWSEARMKSHVRSIIEGKFSRGDVSEDVALIEERVRPHNKFRYFTYKGTPDIRVVVFRNIPVMAMIRWPTKESQGKANASLGAVASGIDMATGITTHSLQDINGRINLVEFVPGTTIRYGGFKVPYWNKILNISVRASQATGLGFCAVDFLIDRDRGPVIVEMNARPGLRIQIANQDGLRWRLEQLRYFKAKSVAHAVRVGKDLFGGEIAEEIEAIAGKKLISLIQPIELDHKDGTKKLFGKAKVDTGATFSSIDENLAINLGFGDAVKLYKSLNIPDDLKTREEGEKIREKFHDILVAHEDIVDTHVIINSNGRSYRFLIEINCHIGEKEFTIHANIRDRSQLQYPVLLGKRDLKDFLIDPSLITTTHEAV